MNYIIRFAGSQTILCVTSIDEAERQVREFFPAAEIGHSGDLRSGGRRTLFWGCAADAKGDDGRRAAGYIVPGAD